MVAPASAEQSSTAEPIAIRNRFLICPHQAVSNNPKGRVWEFWRARTHFKDANQKFGETRVETGWLQRGRSADKLVGGYFETDETCRLYRNVIFGAIDLMKNRPRPNMRGKRPHHRPAAFMTVAALLRSQGKAGGRGLSRRRRMVVMMAARHALHRRCHRFPHTVIRRHRQRRRHRGTHPREQDQQQEFGGPAVHIFRKRGGEPGRRPSFPTSVITSRNRNGAAADLRIGQFPPEHNPR